MLQKLIIKNYALIESLEIMPSGNLNIITGETGAGKSILLGALGLLLGKRADSKALKNHDSKCVIEGEFDISKLNLDWFFKQYELDIEEHTIIRREVTVSGKSRSFINDTPVTLDVVRNLGQYLIDIHSQHQTILLKESGFQMNILDSFAGNKKGLSVFKKQFLEYRKLVKNYNKVLASYENAQTELDYNSYLLNELSECDAQDGEHEKLEKDLHFAEHAKDIKVILNNFHEQVTAGDSSIANQLYDLKYEFDKISSLSEDYDSYAKRLESVTLELEDLSNEVLQKSGEVDFDDESIELMTHRMNLLNNLMSKHHVVTVDELIDKRIELDASLNNTFNDKEQIKVLKEQIEFAEKELVTKAKIISKNRQKIIPIIENRVNKELLRVGMPQAQIEIALNSIELNNLGIDDVEFNFSANKGILAQPLGKVASGGEFSRLMFVLKYLLTEKTQLPTVIFDEIDTGISGEIAIKMAEMMSEMARNHQLITITHLPQVAGFGDNHFFVYKDQSGDQARSDMRELSKVERINELAKMIGGDEPSEGAFQSAKELLKV
jgi:DNA repair protein RecN (Recombination protein N)